VIVHQLLCGRDLANKRRNPPEDGALWRVWEFAESMRNFVYLIVDVQAREAMVLDGCWDVDGIFAYAQGLGVKVTGALYSHSHFDHTGGCIPTSQTGGVQLVVGGVKDFIQRGVPVWAGEKDVATIVRQCHVQPDQLQVAQEGECLHVGGTRCTAIATPGHTPGSVSLHVPSTGSPGSSQLSMPGVQVVAREGALLSGDTLFVQACGRTDLPESSQDDMMRSLSRLIQGLPDGCVVCPGHDYASDPHTTIANERMTNQMVSMGLRAHQAPAGLPENRECSCTRRLRRTAAEFMAPPELRVSGLAGGELLFDGVPGRASVGELRETVFEHLTSSLYTADSRKPPKSADELRVSDGSGREPLRDDVILREAPGFDQGFVVTGAALPRDSIRRPWFAPSGEVVLDGLRNAPELNGQAALVSDWVADRGRYEVLVTAVGLRDIKHVKPDNLRRATSAMVRQHVPAGFGGNDGQEVDETWRVVFDQKVVVRAEPTLTGRILASRKPGDSVRVCRRKGEWVQLHPAEGFGSLPAWLLTDGAAKGLGKLLVLEDRPALAKPPEPRPPAAVGGYPQPAAEPKAPDPPPAPVAPRPTAPRPAAAASPPVSTAVRAEQMGLEDELERVEMEKAAAIEDEDYDLAAELKQRQKELYAQLKELERSAADESAARLQALKDELQQVKARKLEAVEAEDFQEASALKRRQTEIEAEVRQLEGGSA